MAKNNFQYGGWNSYTLQCSTITTLISSGDCTLQCGMCLWNRHSEFTKWQHPAMWYVALRWHSTEFAQTSAILEFYIWFPFRPYHRSRHVILHQCPKFYPNRPPSAEKNDVVSIFKMVDLSQLGLLGPDNGFFEKPMYDFLQVVNGHRSSKLLSFWENRVFLHFGDRQTNRQTDKQTDGQHRCTKPLSLSRAAAW